jgi:hypothetical protein
LVGLLCIGLGVPGASCPRQLACTLVPFSSRPLPWVGEGVAPSCWQMVPRPTAPMPPRPTATPMSLWVPPSSFAWHGAPGMLLPWVPTALQFPVSQFPSLALGHSKDLWSELLADVGASSLMPPWPKIWKKQHLGGLWLGTVPWTRSPSPSLPKEGPDLDFGFWLWTFPWLWIWLLLASAGLLAPPRAWAWATHVALSFRSFRPEAEAILAAGGCALFSLLALGLLGAEACCCDSLDLVRPLGFHLLRELSAPLSQCAIPARPVLLRPAWPWQLPPCQ